MLQAGKTLCHCTHPERHCKECKQFCPDYDASKEALREHLIENRTRDELFEEMVAYIKLTKTSGGAHDIAKALLAKIDALKGE